MQVCDGVDASPDLLCQLRHQLQRAGGVCWFSLHPTGWSHAPKECHAAKAPCTLPVADQLEKQMVVGSVQGNGLPSPWTQSMRPARK